MKEKNIKQAVAIARIFIQRADSLFAEQKRLAIEHSKQLEEKGIHADFAAETENCPKQAGSLRRMSMELTRSLSSMRAS